jgi:hypothetical protein
MVRLQRNDPLEIGGKRSRPVSSLDYKADRADPKLIAFDGPNRMNSGGQQQSEWKRGGNGGGGDNGKQRHMNPITRSRGSGGIPKLPRTLQDLEGMTQDEMSEALSNDPALAEQFKQATEQYQQQQRQQQREAGHTRRSSSNAGSSGGGGSKSSSFVNNNGKRATRDVVAALAVAVAAKAAPLSKVETA